MIYLQLILTFLKIGLFSFGGGYAVLGMIIDEVVNANGWMTMEEFADIAAIAEMTPGPLAVNAATFVGMKLAGFSGAVTATVAVILPAAAFVAILAFVYKKYRELEVMRGVIDGILPVIGAVIVCAAVKLTATALGMSSMTDIAGIDLFAAAAVALAVVIKRCFKVNSILLMAASGIAGGIYYYFVT